jgi:hypothetical protein
MIRDVAASCHAGPVLATESALPPTLDATLLMNAYLCFRIRISMPMCPLRRW